MQLLVDLWYLWLILIFLLSGLVTVNQGSIAVITLFGKYRRILLPGLNFKIPIIERVYKTISIKTDL